MFPSNNQLKTLIQQKKKRKGKADQRRGRSLPIKHAIPMTGKLTLTSQTDEFRRGQGYQIHKIYS